MRALTGGMLMPEGEGGFSWDFLVGVYSPVLEIMTLFLTEKCHFPHPFSDLASKILTLFQIWRWSQNAPLHVYIKQRICHHCIKKIS